jgi:digeranylgeranylglycerophospholipid reductase
MRYDLIIVGAGPAGATCARYATKNDVHTLIIDKRKEIGIPVQCGELLPTVDELQHILPNVDNLHELFDIEDRVISRNINGIQVYSPAGRVYDIPFTGISIDRDRFDKYLVEKSNAEISLNTTFLKLYDNKVVTNKGTLRTRVIVGADGPFSKVAVSVGLNANKKVALGLTCKVKGDFGDVVKMYFSRRIARGGYAWVIPKRGYANVGLGVQSSVTPISKLLKKFLSDHHMKTKKITAGHIPISGPLQRTVNRNVLLVGDAAGQVMVTNGGGIPISMICGRIAGEIIGSYIHHGTPLQKYDVEWRRAVGKELRIAVRTKRLADIFAFSSDILMEFSMRKLKSKGIEKVIKCKKLLGS